MSDQNFNIKVFDSYQEIGDFVRSILLADVVSGSFNIALSGGRTPRSVFSHLSEHKKPHIKWDMIKFFWGDERCVPPDHADSNFLMAKESLFNNIDIADDQIFRIKGENNPDAEKERYKMTVLSNTNGIFDLMLLGLGSDGHTASIFPNRMDLLGSKEVCGVAIHPDSGQTRITLTGPVINNSRKILFLVTGSEKSQIVYEILYRKGEWDKYPASYIKPVDGELIWILDRKAAICI